jgi:pilus assembly protein CpaB
MKVARLVVLGVAVVAGITAAVLARRTPAPPPSVPAPVVAMETVDVLVAVKDVNVGHVLTADDMSWVAWPAASTNAQFIRQTDRPQAVQQFTGFIARGQIASGEPVRESRLIDAKGSGYLAAILPAGMVAVSTEISPETGAGGFILPNDRVDVLLSHRDREAERLTGVESQIGETLLRDVRVLAIDQTVEEKNGQRVVVGKTATLELSSRQAETLAMARRMGTLSLALRSLVDADPTKRQSAATDDAAPSNRVNMVRFGHSTILLSK